MDRRTLLRTGVGAAAAMAVSAPVLSACSNAGAPVGGGTPRRGGKVAVRRSSAWTTMDPHTSTNADPDYPLMFDYLTRYERQKSGQFELVPGLASKWDQVDDTTIDLTLRRGVEFHDGSNFDATVAAWNIERMMTNPRSAATLQTQGIATVTPRNAQTLRVTLDAPNATFLVNMSYAADSVSAMISQQHVEKVGDDRAALEPIGTGPFRFVSWAQGSRVRWRRWEKYWVQDSSGRRLPWPDEFESILQANDQTAQLRLASGDLNIVDGILGGQVESIERQRTVRLLETPWQGNIFTLVFNARDGARFAGQDNLRIRQAIFHAIDAESAAKVVGRSLGQAVRSPIVKGQIGYMEDAPGFEHDPRKARQLLAQAGVTDTLTIPFDIISRGDDVALAQVYQQMLQEVGVKLVIQPQDKVAWAEKVKAGDFELGSFFGRTRPDPDLALGTFASPQGKTNYAGLDDPAITAALTKGRTTYDPDQRQSAYEQAQQLLAEQAYYSFVWNRRGAIALTDNITGYQPPFFGTVPDATTLALTTGAA